MRIKDLLSSNWISRREHEIILRTILYQVKTAETLADAEYAVEVLCSEETVAIVNSTVLARETDQRRTDTARE
ncbi:MAG: hypothetical protein FWD98_01815 [Defluviitaleaceae bacterium]|nr:hypothetical protein [Defluviitaleaceae bacterium]